MLTRTEFLGFTLALKGITEDVLKAHISVDTAHKQMHEKSQMPLSESLYMNNQP